MAAAPPADAAPAPKDIWDALESAGASAVQAAGIMGNAIAESSLKPEAAVMDSNGQMSYGLWQFNAGSYPSAASLVTGHAMADMVAQVKFLAQVGGFTAATGTTPAQAAATFAANFERCATCQSGGSSSAARQANAAMVAGWASGGAWPSSSGSASDTATLTSAGAAQARATCLWSISNSGVDPSILGWHPVGSVGNFQFCILSKSQGRAIEAVGLMAAGAAVFGLGLVLALAGGDMAGGAGNRVAGAAAGLIPGPVGLIAGLAASEGERESDRRSAQAAAKKAATVTAAPATSPSEASPST